MNKKIIGIIAAVAVIVIIVLVAMNKPRNSGGLKIRDNTAAPRTETHSPADTLAPACDSIATQ